MRFAQLVMGPAGCGKSTYCSTLAKHGECIRRQINVVNLDPAAEQFDYQVMADIRELIHVDDAMEDEELHFGPNGGLIFCMEFLLENLDWLKEQLGDDDEDYILFDCPGQIELYTHMNVMRRLVDNLQTWGFRICGIFLIDSQFMIDSAKFMSGVLTALSAMVNLEIPHINVLSKIDLLSKHSRKQLVHFMEPDVDLLLEDNQGPSKWNENYKKLTEAIGKLVDDYSLVKFFPLNKTDEESIGDLLILIDNAIQYGEEMDVKVKDFDPIEADDDDENGCC